MKRLLILGLWAALGSRLFGGVSEPETILYGKVLTRLGEADYQLVQGELRWTIASEVEGGKTHVLTTRLEPLADGQYSYRLNIPHELLAYDLEVSEEALPLTAGAHDAHHLEITLDGLTAVIRAPADSAISLRQAARAMTYEVNLEVQLSPKDADGDGVPDWLEDRLGLDQWDPTDGGLFLSGLGGGTGQEKNEGTSEPITTFQEWAQHHFPEGIVDLDELALTDHDGDGIPNFSEYSYVLDPKVEADADARSQLPHAEVEGGYFSLVFRKRIEAVDLEYVVEVSEDLGEWTSSDELDGEQAPLELEEDADSGWTQYRTTEPLGSNPVRFFRVRAIRRAEE